MKNLFVMVPVKGRTRKSIKEEQEKIKKMVEILNGEEYTLIDYLPGPSDFDDMCYESDEELKFSIIPMMVKSLQKADLYVTYGYGNKGSTLRDIFREIPTLDYFVTDFHICEIYEIPFNVSTADPYVKEAVGDIVKRSRTEKLLYKDSEPFK